MFGYGRFSEKTLLITRRNWCLRTEKYANDYIYVWSRHFCNERKPPRRIRFLAHPLLSPLSSCCISLFFSLQSPILLAWQLGFCPGTRLPSFYFRVRDALVCYLSSTLTSLLAAIILINISPIGGRREEGSLPYPAVTLEVLFSLAGSYRASFRVDAAWRVRDHARATEKERERESIGGLYDASRVVFASAAWLAITVSSCSAIYCAVARHAGLSLLRFSLLLLSLPSAAPPSGEKEPKMLRPVHSEIERRGEGSEDEGEGRSPSGPYL